VLGGPAAGLGGEQAGGVVGEGLVDRGVFAGFGARDRGEVAGLVVAVGGGVERPGPLFSPVVAGIGDPEVFFAVDSKRLGFGELAVIGTRGAELTTELPVAPGSAQQPPQLYSWVRLGR
jgi:hypothetical protein